MPIYPGRRKGTFRVTVWARGKQVEETVEGSRSEALEHEARMRLAHGKRSRLTQRIAPHFSDFCREQYSPHASEHLGADTWNKVRRYQVATLAAFFGGYRLTELSTSLVDEYKRQRSKLVLPSSVNNELRVLRTMMSWAHTDRELPVAEIKIRRLPTEGTPRVHCWSTPDVSRLLASCRRIDPDFEPLLLFLLNTGCRKGEALAAEWSWVNLKGRVLSIPVTRYWRPKSKRPREVPIGDTLYRVLRDLPKPAPPWLFPNVLGERYATFPQKRFKAVVAGARGVKLSGGPHTCRHTYASHFLQAFPDLPALAGILGHSTTRVTELYTHLLPGHLARARNAVNLGAGPGSTLDKGVASA